jgi:hypothetical protein
MKWVCIDNKGYEEQLVVGKVYTEIYNARSFVDYYCILIKDETGIPSEYYQPLRFVKIDEWRDIQLKGLGL